MQKLRQGDWFKTNSFCFLKKPYMRLIKWSGVYFNMFRWPSTWHTIKTSFIKL